MHLSIENKGDGGTADSYNITVLGISFGEAQHTSVKMRDPRGRVTFEGCKWEDNEGTSSVPIGGRYAGIQQPPPQAF